MKRRSRFVWLAAWMAGLLLVPAASPARAAEQEVVLSLAEALDLALRNNLDLVQARIAPQLSEADVTVQDAAFDGTLSAGAQRFEAAQEATDISTAPGFRQNSFDLTYGQLLPFGAELSARLSSEEQDVDVPPGDVFFSTPTEFSTALQLDVTMPLLQGRGKEPTTERLLLARANLDISEEELRRQAELTLEVVEGAYWDVVARSLALDVANESLKRAQALLRLNEKKVEVGTLAPIEITQAQAGVAAQKESVILAQTNLANAEDELRRLLAVPPGDPMWSQRIVPSDALKFEPAEPQLEQAIEQGLASRPEVLSARKELHSSELSERVARNGVRHQLDLGLTYTPGGTDVDEFSAVFTGPGPDGVVGTDDDVFESSKIGDATMVDALEEIPELANRSWSARLIYTYPLGNRAAKANYRKAQLNRERSVVGLQNQEQTVRVDVRRAVRGVESGGQRVEAAQENVRLQQEKLDAEQKKYDNGMSTSFEVLTFQTDLSNAELSQIQALVDYRKALVALERSKGMLLAARGLRLE